jgi:hypothetical protein
MGYHGYPLTDVTQLLGFDERRWQQERQRDLLRTPGLTWDKNLKEAGPHFNGDEVTVFFTSDGVCTCMHVDFIGGMACLVDGFKLWLWCDAGDLKDLGWRPGQPLIDLARASQLPSFRWSLGGPGVSFSTHPDVPHAVVTLTGSLLITWPQTLLPFRQLRALALSATNYVEDAIWLVNYERGGFHPPQLYVKAFEGILSATARRVQQWLEAGPRGWSMLLHSAHSWRTVSPLIAKLMAGTRWRAGLDAKAQTALNTIWTEFADLFGGPRAVVNALIDETAFDIHELVRPELLEEEGEVRPERQEGEQDEKDEKDDIVVIVIDD